MAYAKPQQRKKDESEQLRGEREISIILQEFLVMATLNKSFLY